MRSCHDLAGIPDKKSPLREAHWEAKDVGVTTAMVAKQENHQADIPSDILVTLLAVVSWVLRSARGLRNFHAPPNRRCDP